MLAALDRVKPTWDDAQFIPHPATWLNQERWDDEPDQVAIPPPSLDARRSVPGKPISPDEFAEIRRQLHEAQ